MEKRNITICHKYHTINLFLSIIISIVFLFPSCKTPLSSEKDEKTFVFEGSITNNFEYTPAAENNRTALPDPATAPTLTYTVKAYKGNATGNTVPADNGKFTIALSTGTWILVAEGKYSNNLYLEGKQSVTINEDGTIKDASIINITVRPVQTEAGTGKVNLQIKIPSSIKAVTAKWRKDNITYTNKLYIPTTRTDKDTINFFMTTGTPADGKTTAETIDSSSTTAASIKSGIYEVAFEFSGDEEPFVINEVVYVFDYFTTTKWITTAKGTEGNPTGNEWIDSSGVFDVTDMQAKRLHSSYYVEFNKAVNGIGTEAEPYNNLQSAVDHITEINDGTTEYFVLITNNLSYGSNTDFAAGDGRLLTIKHTQAKPLHLTIKSNDLTVKRTINLNRSAAHKGGIININTKVEDSNPAEYVNSFITLENLILEGAYTSKSGAAIGMENGTKSDSTRTGIDLTLKNCIIRNNTTNSDDGNSSAGAIMVSVNNRLEAVNTTFESNSVGGKYGNGGAIYLWGAANFKNCTFNSNSATTTTSNTLPYNYGTGGAVIINFESNNTTDNKYAKFYDCTFTSNTAQGYGGAIENNCTATDATVLVQNCTFSENTSGTLEGGGAINLYSSSKLSICGKNIIKNNTSGAAASKAEDNLRINNTKHNTPGSLSITGSLQDSCIGISRVITDASTSNTIITNQYYTYNSGINPSEIFFSDNNNYIIGQNSTLTSTNRGEVKIFKVTAPSFTLDSNTFSLYLDKTVLTSTLVGSVPYKDFYTLKVTGSKNLSSINMRLYKGPEEIASSGNYELSASNPGKASILDTLTLLNPMLLPGEYQLWIDAVAEDGSVANIKRNITFAKYKDTIPETLPVATSSSPKTFYLSTEDSLKRISKLTEENSTNSSSWQYCTIELDSDIEISGDWTPIGTSASYFCGNINGHNKTITFDCDSKSFSHFGLIACLQGGTISDLTVASKAPIKIDDATLSGSVYYGGIVGLAKGGTIRNCTNDIDFIIKNCTATTSIGGICGASTNSSSSFINCVNNGNITDERTDTNYTSYFAGIYSGQKISESLLEFANNFINCENYGNITNKQQNALSAGIATASSGQFLNCCNYGNISSTGTGGTTHYTAGIVGVLQIDNLSKTIANCYNTGNINGANVSGGIAAYVYKRTGVTESNLTTNEFINLYSSGTITGASNSVGGIIGQVSNFATEKLTFKNCYYTTTDAIAKNMDSTAENPAGCNQITSPTPSTGYSDMVMAFNIEAENKTVTINGKAYKYRQWLAIGDGYPFLANYDLWDYE